MGESPTIEAAHMTVEFEQRTRKPHVACGTRQSHRFSLGLSPFLGQPPNEALPCWTPSPDYLAPTPAQGCCMLLDVPERPMVFVEESSPWPVARRGKTLELFSISETRSPRASGPCPEAVFFQAANSSPRNYKR